MSIDHYGISKPVTTSYVLVKERKKERRDLIREEKRNNQRGLLCYFSPITTQSSPKGPTIEHHIIGEFFV